jgi:hypothetical protein
MAFLVPLLGNTNPSDDAKKCQQILHTTICPYGWTWSHTLLNKSITSTRRPVLAAKYQEQAQMLCDLLWPSWHGCFVILHAKPFDFLATFKPMLLYVMAVFDPILLMIWYHRHYYIGMIWYRPWLYDGMMWYHPRLWDEMIWYILPSLVCFPTLEKPR